MDLNLFMSTTIYGGVLALLSLGITLIYMTTGVVNFAHPRLSLVGAYLATTAMAVYVREHGIQANFSSRSFMGGELIVPYPASVYLIGLTMAIIGGILAAMAEYYVILKPLQKRGADSLKLMIATLAYDFLLYAILFLYNSHSWVKYILKEALNLLASKMDFSPYDFTLITKGQVYITGGFILTVIIVALLAVTLYLLLFKTTLGIKMRASVENPPLAEVLGVNVDRIYGISWIISGLTAGIAGFLMLLEPSSGGLKPISASSPADEIVVSAFAGSIVGGVNSIFGSIFGGFFIGYVETYVAHWLALVTGYSELFKFSRVISMFIVGITLLFAPQGIAGYLKEKNAGELFSRLFKRSGGEG